MSRKPTVLGALTWHLVSALAGGQAYAQCGSTWTAGLAPAVNGVNGLIYASLSWDHDGSAATPNRLVVGGDFDIAGATTAYNLAMWDGANWQAFGLGTNLPVRALAVYNGQLVIGGDFTAANAVPANRVARWTGTTFQAFGTPASNGITGTAGGLPSTVRALACHNNDLYVGGWFTTAAGIPVVNVAHWNGSGWSAMAGGLFGGPVHALLMLTGIFGPVVVAGGEFDLNGTAYGKEAVALWDGSAWATLGDMFPTYPCGFGGLGSCAVVLSLYSNSVDLYATGLWRPRIEDGPYFQSSVTGLAVLADADTWTDVGLGCSLGGIPPHYSCTSTFTSMVSAVAEYNGQLFAGTKKRVGTNWVASGISGSLYSLTVHNGELYACGGFTQAAGVPARNIAKWNGSTWSAVAPTLSVRALAVFHNALKIGGTFIWPIVGSQPAAYLATYNGTALSSEPDGVTAPVHSLWVHVPGGLSASHLIAGGDFTGAGGFPASRIADQVVFGWDPMGAGFSSTVLTSATFNNAIYAGGAFTLSGTTTVNRIARWNGPTASWQPLSNGANIGVNGTVRAMAVYNGSLYVGGSFTTAGGVTTGGLARWNGTAWSAVLGNFVGVVNALAVYNGDLVIGGAFTGVPGAPNIARYNGTVFSSYDGAGTNAAVRALAVDGSVLYVGGDFTSAGGVAASRIASWDSVFGWRALGTGVNNTVYALRPFGGKLHVGGAFTVAGGLSSPCWAIWESNIAPAIAQHPQDSAVNCRDDAVFTVVPVSGSTLPAYQWRRNGVNLTNGPQPNGSTISGATAAVLTITSTRTANVGSYDVVLSNACGSTTSSAATLEVLGCGCLADINGDDAVNVSDLLAVINSWGQCNASSSMCAADISPPGLPVGDGQVTVSDLLMVINEWGPCSSP